MRLQRPFAINSRVIERPLQLKGGGDAMRVTMSDVRSILFLILYEISFPTLNPSSKFCRQSWFL